MKKLKNIFRTRSKSRGSSGSLNSNALEIDDAEIRTLPNIHQAVINDDSDKVKKLLKVELESKDSKGRTPLFIACLMQKWDIVSMLLDAKCKVDESDNNNVTPLMKAIQSKDIGEPFGIAQANQFVSYNCDILHVNSDIRTCLHYLAMSKCNDRAAVFNALLMSKKSLKVRQRVQDLPDKDKLTALHLAVLADNFEVCMALVENGASVNVVDSLGRTPLMLCCSSENEEICKILLSANPELHHKDKKGRNALTIAHESPNMKCVPLIEDYQRDNPSSTTDQSWEDTTEMESDEAEEVDDEEDSVISPAPVDKSQSFLELESENAQKKDSEQRTKSDIDEVSTSSEEPAFSGTVRFREQGESGRPKLQMTEEEPPVATIVKPVSSVSSPKTADRSGSNLFKQLTKSNDSNDDVSEPIFQLDSSTDQRHKDQLTGSGGQRLGNSFDLSSDVVKTSIDSVTSGMSNEWDSATEPSGAYAPPQRKDIASTNNDIPKTPDEDDWSEGPAIPEFPLDTKISNAVKSSQDTTIASKPGGDQHLTSLVAESVHRVILGDKEKNDRKDNNPEAPMHYKKSSSAMWDDSDLSEIALSSSQQAKDNNNRVLDDVNDDLGAPASRPTIFSTDMSQASSRWDTDDFSSELVSPSRPHAKIKNDDDTDVSSDVDDDEDEDVAAEMGKYLEGSLIGEGGNWLGPAKKADNKHLPPVKEVTLPSNTLKQSSRQSSASSLNQQNPSDWLGIEVELEPERNENQIHTNADDNNKVEAFAAASEISMPDSPELNGVNLPTSQLVERKPEKHTEKTESFDDDMTRGSEMTFQINLENPAKISSHRFNEPMKHVAKDSSSGIQSPVDDEYNRSDEENEGEVQPLIDNLFSLSGSITDTYQLTRVQESIRQLSSRCHADERKIASLTTENKMLRDDISLLEQKLESVNTAKSVAEKNVNQLELKLSSLEAEQVADARKISSSSERLRIQLHEAERKIASLQDEAKNLEREKNHVETKLISLESQLRQAESERDLAKQQQQSQQQQMLSLSTNNRDDLRTEISRLMEENSKLNIRLDDAARQQKKAESQLESLKIELNTSKTSLRSAEKRNDDNQRSSDVHIKRLTEDIIQKDVELAKIGESHRNAALQLESVQTRLLHTENELASAKRLNQEQSQQLQSSNEELRQARNDGLVDREKAQKLELKNASLEQRIVDLERRLVDLQRQLDDSNHALSNRRSSGANEMFTSGPSPIDTRSLSLMEMRCHELMESKSRLNEDLVRMESAKKAADLEVRHAASRISDLEKRANTAEMNYELTQRSLDEASRKIQKSEDDFRRAQIDISDRNNDIDRLRRELASSQQELAANITSRSYSSQSDLMSRLKSTEGELKSKDSELIELRQKHELQTQMMNSEITKLQLRADDARAMWEQEVKTKAGVGQLLVEAERRRDTAENELLIAKNEARRLEDQLRLAERRVEDELHRTSDIEVKLAKSKGKLAEVKAKANGVSSYDEKLSELSRQLDQQRLAYEDRISVLKKQIEEARREVESERSVRDRSDNERRNLEIRLAKVSGLEAQVIELSRQKAAVEAEFSHFREAISRTHVERSVMDAKLEQLDAKLKAEFDTRIAQFHLSLADLDREREHTDHVRKANDESKTAFVEFEKQQLADELHRVRSAYNTLISGNAEGDRAPMTSTPIAPPVAEASEIVESLPNNDGHSVNRRLIFDRLQPVMGNEHLSKIFSSQLVRSNNRSPSPAFMSTSMVNPRLVHSSSAQLNRGSLLSASFHYAVPPGSSFRVGSHRRRDVSIESLRAQLDRAIAIGLSGKTFKDY